MKDQGSNLSFYDATFIQREFMLLFFPRDYNDQKYGITWMLFQVQKCFEARLLKPDYFSCVCVCAYKLHA